MRPVFASFLFLSVLCAAERPVLDSSRSPAAALRGVPVTAVKMGAGFWEQRRKVNVESSLPTLLTLFEEKGILDNFRRTAGKKDVERRGPLYTDSDIYKWLEAVAFVLQSGDHPTLRKAGSAAIDDIVSAQEPSGYVNTYYSRERAAERHTNMRHGHELYCLGHMLQAGIAWERATGERKLLDAAVKKVEYLLRDFGPEKKPIFEGHPEIEMALVELYRSTGDKRYLDFAGYFLGGDSRNLAQIPPRELVYLFTGKPFNERTRLEGHAVRAMYACSGATDYYLETGDKNYWRTLDNLWQDMTARQMYLTGGVGARSEGEAFGDAYELPNRRAYTESCAAIASMFWNWRMLQATGDGKYADVFERALYNGANSGLSLNGTLYCYRNPLEHRGDSDRIRNPWYDTTCCPPNLQRILASLPGYFYSTSKEGLWVHLFDRNTLDWKLEDSTKLRVEMNTSYPWDGRVELDVFPERPREFTLFLRQPGWSGATRIEVAGAVVSGAAQNGYLPVKRMWNPGDRVTITLNMAPRLTAANPMVAENSGKAAVERGPLVYCMEALDQPGGAVSEWVLDLNGKKEPLFKIEAKPDLLGGVTVLKHSGLRYDSPVLKMPLYTAMDELRQQAMTPGELVLIPYYTFHNREMTSMQVWIPYR
jgi:DUF1680 family protein